MKKPRPSTMSIAVRQATDNPGSGTEILRINGVTTTAGNTSTFQGFHEDGSLFELTDVKRKKRKSDAERMTTILATAVEQRATGVGATAASGVAVESERTYFRDLTAMGGRDAWTIATVPMPDRRGYCAAAFFKQALKRNGSKLVGPGWALLRGEDIARFHREIEIEATPADMKFH